MLVYQLINLRIYTLEIVLNTLWCSHSYIGADVDDDDDFGYSIGISLTISFECRAILPNSIQITLDCMSC